MAENHPSLPLDDSATKTAREGLEPSLRGPEPRVLPLDDRAIAVDINYTLIIAVCQIFFNVFYHNVGNLSIL